MEVRLQLLGCGPIVHIAHVDGPIVDLHFVVDRERRTGGAHSQWHVHLGLQQLKLFRLLLHLLDTRPDSLQFRINLVVGVVLEKSKVILYSLWYL